MKICIDPGHGGSDPGAIGKSPFRVEEKQVNLAVGLLLEAQLEGMGHWVILTRRGDRALGLAARADFANRLGADLFVSLHSNAAGAPETQGFEIFAFPGAATGTAIAARVLQSLATAFPAHRNRGVKEADFAVLRLTDMPAILVELEFLTNPVQLSFLADPANQMLLASALADGIDRCAGSIVQPG
jgi:N-acetylmuramoyl-L-alanine amidase